jgi:hypothetical protein
MNGITTDVFTIVQTNFRTVINSSGNFQINYASSSMARYLGFTTRTGLSTAATSITSEYAPVLSPAILYINVEGFSSNIVSTTGVPASFICPMLSNNSKYNIITEDRLMNQKIETIERNYTTMRITMYDEFSNVITLQSEWMFVLEECD